MGQENELSPGLGVGSAPSAAHTFFTASLLDVLIIRQLLVWGCCPLVSSWMNISQEEISY